MGLNWATWIVLAEDDEDDRLLFREALGGDPLQERVVYVADGQALLDLLAAAVPGPNRGLPGLILLDLNMPGKDGRQSLAEIKGNPQLRGVPVVVLTTSEAEEDIVGAYAAGANSYIKKPGSFREYVETVNRLVTYWFHTVRLPHQG